jgi:trans-aconitate methyltransferase
MSDEIQRWKPGLYDSKLGIVSELGKGVVDWLDPKPGERILDLGCGTGDLANVIASAGAEVTGMDASEPMIEAARLKYPGLHFITGDGQRFEAEPLYNAVFSNAALHWMKDAGAVAANVWSSLKPGGRFVAEFGGQGNVSIIIRAVQTVLRERYGREPEGESGPWYFPTIGEYSSLLERSGFQVVRAVHFDRPTPLPDGREGLKHWLDSFGDSLFKGKTPEERTSSYDGILGLAAPELYREDGWKADYKRIRIEAFKKV